jgi:hypothetical protein
VKKMLYDERFPNYKYNELDGLDEDVNIVRCHNEHLGSRVMISRKNLIFLL